MCLRVVRVSVCQFRCRPSLKSKKIFILRRTELGTVARTMIKPLALLWFTCDSYVLWSVESETLPTHTDNVSRALDDAKEAAGSEVEITF